MQQKILEKLQDNFKPNFLEMINKSHLHKGHLAQDKTSNISDFNQTHFLVKISANALENIPKIEAHRKINKVLKDCFNEGLHSLEIEIVSISK